MVTGALFLHRQTETRQPQRTVNINAIFHRTGGHQEGRFTQEFKHGVVNT